MVMNCILAGVGGQGTVLASKLIAQSAMNKGLKARTAETIGMAQRGGCVVSHVRIGDEIHSPMIPKHAADVIIGFEPAEAVRCFSYLKKGGTVIINQKAIRPVSASLTDSAYDGSDMIDFLKKQDANVIVIDGEKICEECASSKVLNVALLGAACALFVLGIHLDEMNQAIEQRVASRFIDMNQKALAQGALAAKNK